MPGDQDDVDGLFDAIAPAPRASVPEALGKKPEARKDSRVRANWQARVLLPGGRMVDLHVFDLSEGGVGLISEVAIPANTVLTFAIAVPGLHEPSKITAVTGTMKTTHMTIKGDYVHCGGTWVSIAGDSRELLNQWIRRLRK